MTTLTPKAPPDYASAICRLENLIRNELLAWGIGGLACALVDDQKIIFAAGFGEAKRDSLFRVGSISKSFNALAALQLVETGALQLDAPLPADILPLNPFPEQPGVTLRQILSHRSGLQREAAVGGYFDDTQPTLAATAASVAPCVLVSRPGEKFRYSNLGPALVGHLVECISGQSYADYQQVRLLEPLGMASSAWTLSRLSRNRLVPACMRVTDGRGGWTRRAAPLFDAGSIPAGNLFSCVDDLARFAATMMGGGGGLVKPETLQEMWRPQLPEADVGHGLGFLVGRFREHNTVGHSGAVYGYTSQLVILPIEKVAVVVLANEDNIPARVSHICEAALTLMLEAKCGNRLPDTPVVSSLPRDLAIYAGDYESQSFWCRLAADESRLVGSISGQPTFFEAAGDLRFTAHSRVENATTAKFDCDDRGTIVGFTLGAQRFRRAPSRASVLPPAWRAVLGEYGPEIMPLVITERNGHLYAMTENLVDYRLTALNRHVCALPPGMYEDEHLVLLSNEAGQVHSVNFANMVLRRTK